MLAQAMPTPTILTTKYRGSLIKYMEMRPIPPAKSEMACVFLFPNLAAILGKNMAYIAETPL